jgi:hypothetical protein
MESSEDRTVQSELMYTGETAEEFYARRRPLENLWNGFMAGMSRQQFGNHPGEGMPAEGSKQ